MSDERIDIEINDKIDPSIPTKLSAIATGATKGHSAVQKLKAELASINDTPTRKLAAATNEVTNAVNRELNSQRNVKTARDSANTSLKNEARNRDRINDMIDRSIAKYEAEAAAKRRSMAAASGPGALVGSRSTAAAQDAQMAAQSTRSLASARLADASAARVQEAATEASTAALQRHGKAAGLNRAQLLNLGFQLQDIVVALQMGQNPLTVFIQQGGQIGQIASQAGIGIRGMTAAVWGFLAPWLPLIAVLGTAFAAFKLFQSEVEDDAGLKEYTKTLGLTKQEMKELKDVSVTAGDMFSGLWKTISDRTGVDESIRDFKSFIIDQFKKALNACGSAIAELYGAIVGTFRATKKTWSMFPAMLGDLFVQGVNAAIGSIEKLVNASIAGVNRFASGANALLGADLFGQINEVQLGRVENQWAGAAKQVRDTFKAEVEGATNEAKGAMKSFFDDWKKNSIQAAKDRLRGQADKIKDDRGPGPKGKEDKTAENRAHALSMVNMELDKELARMKLLKDERAVQQRMDQIEQSLAQKKITLNETERASIEGKVRAIEAYKFVQSELDRMYEEAIGPQRDFNSTLQAGKELLDQGAISVAQYGQQVELAKRKLAEAKDPLFAIKEGLTQAEAALGKYGLAAQQAAFYETIRQAALQKGIVMSPQYVAGVNAETDALMKRNAAILQQQQIESTVGQIVNPMLQDQMMLQNKQFYYDELTRMADAYDLSEGQRMQARFALDAMFMEKRLQNASKFFGDLSSLSRSGNKKLAMIGKAAAVAQATIDGVLAVQKALASAPPPVNFALAAAAGVAAAVNVATIISTPVGSYNTGGQFMVRGNQGVDKNNINMNVSDRERVTIETPAQQRANDRAGGGGPSVVAVKMINVLDPADMIAALDSGDYDHVIVNAISRNSNQVSNLVSGGNGG